MKIPKIYHSAFKEDYKNLEELEYYENNGSIVFKHDINNGISNLFFNCDCIYSEPAWKNGYKLFISRANEESLSYESYLKSIENNILTIKKPAFLIGGKHMIKYIKPHINYDIYFNGFYAQLLCWFYDKLDFKTNIDVLNYLKENFNTVLDFSCGYGNHLNGFKRFIASDINSKCVYYVAKNYMNY